MESQRLCKKSVRHGTHLPKCHVCKWPVMCKRGLRPLPFRHHQYSESGILQSPHQEVVMHMWKQALLPSPADGHRHLPAWDVPAPRIQITRLAICLSPLLNAHVSHVGGIFQISSRLRTWVGWWWWWGLFLPALSPDASTTLYVGASTSLARSSWGSPSSRDCVGWPQPHFRS